MSKVGLFKKFFKKKKNKKSRKIYKSGLCPTRDWFIILCVFAVLLAIMGISAYYVFVEIVKGKSEIESYKSNNLTIDEELLRSTVNIYKEKGDTYTELLNSEGGIIDPSV
jgi:hypothetical protein